MVLINTIELNHGEFAGIGIIEIVSIPNFFYYIGGKRREQIWYKFLY